MPTSIVGTPTGVASPSLQPDPDTVPSLAAPQDIIDPVSAVTVNQPFTALANEIAYLKRPTAGIPGTPGGLDAKYVQAMRRERNARGNTRAAIDHFGFFNGNTVGWDEQWDEPELQFINTTGNTFSRRWAFHTDGSGVLGGTLTSGAPQYVTAAEGHRLLAITSIPNGGRADIQLRSNAWTGCFTDDLVVGMFWPFLLEVHASTNCSFLMGFTTNFQPSNAITDGAFFYKTPTDVNWQCKTISAGGGGSTVVDSGAPAGTGSLYRAAIVLVGANQSDDSTARALFFIDGAVVANIAAHLPYTSGGAGAGLPLSPIFGVNTTTGASATEIDVGPVRYRQSMFAGDSFM